MINVFTQPIQQLCSHWCERTIGTIYGCLAIYLEQRVMPADDAGDAAHLAVASYHGVDYLLTWNCRHLANANRFSHIREINRRLGLMTPELVTPEQFFEEK